MLRSLDGLLPLSHLGSCLTFWLSTYTVGICHTEQDRFLECPFLNLRPGKNCSSAWGALSPPHSFLRPFHRPSSDARPLRNLSQPPQDRSDPHARAPQSNTCVCLSRSAHIQQTLSMTTFSRLLDAVQLWDGILHLCVLCTVVHT